MISLEPQAALVQYYRWLRTYDLNDSHSGNASIRLGDTVWVTPTGACADTLEAEDLVACALHEPANPRASVDATLHLEIYRQNPQAQVVLHSHGPHTIAATLSGQDFVPIDFEGQYYFQRVPVVNLPYENCIQAAVAPVSALLATERAAIVRGHGVYVQAKDLNLAYKWTCSLESSARLTLLARQAGTA